MPPPVGGTLPKKHLPLIGVVLASTMGGILLGASLAAISKLLGALSVTGVGIALGLAMLAVIAMLWSPASRLLPERRRQVSSRLLLGPSRFRASLRWGFELGIGVSTYAVTPAFYLVLALGLAADSLRVPLLMGAAYGMARGIAIAAFSIRRSWDIAKGAASDFGSSSMRRVLDLSLLVIGILSLAALVLAT